VLEAMAAGKPVVAARSGGTPEVVVDGETGLLYRPGDVTALRETLIRLAGDPALRRQLGEAGRARVVEHFGVDRMVKEYESLYLKLTERSSQV
jgi:glycosyltransferase involved in cell wall biosynthesis